MTEAQLEIHTIDRDPFAIIKIKGELRTATVYDLKHECNRLIEYYGRNLVIIDAAELAYSESSGIGVFMYAFNLCRQMGGRLAIVEPRNEQCRDSLFQSRLNSFIEFQKTADGALKALCQKMGLNIPDIDLSGEGIQEKTLEQRVEELESRLKMLEDKLLRPTA